MPSCCFKLWPWLAAFACLALFWRSAASVEAPDAFTPMTKGDAGTRSQSKLARLADSGMDNAEFDIYDLPPNDEARLVTGLINRYQGYGMARPVALVNKTLDVSLLFIINEFLGINELTGVMEVTAMIVASWQDDNLHWNPNEFNQIKEMPMRTKDVFLPPIVRDGNGGTQSSIFMTGAGQNDKDINSMVWVRNDGLVEARVTAQYVTACDLNLADFPFDSQTCRFTFRSWRFDNKRVRLRQAKGQNVSEHIDDSAEVNINANANWLMDSITSRDDTLTLNGEKFSVITYEVIATRRSDYYTWNVLLPSISMAIVQLATFFVPFGPDRSMFCITMVLVMHIFQQALTSKLPTTDEVIPYVRQTTTQLILSVGIAVESAVVWWIAAKDKRSPVPQILRKLVPALRKRDRMEKEWLIKEALLASKKRAWWLEQMQASSSMLNRQYSDSLLASRMSSLTDMSEPVTSIDEEFIIWGEWLEVAQLVDLFMLGITVGCMVLLPIYYYR